VKVLVLSYFYPPEIGAPALRMQAITEAFVRRGWDVTVVTGMPQYPTGRTFPGYRGKLRHRESLFGARVERVFTYPTQGLGLYRMASYLSQALGAAAVGALQGTAWDLVFVESPPLSVGLPPLWLSRLRRARLALDVTDLWPDSAREITRLGSGSILRMAERLERALYARAWRISCPTHGIARRLWRDKGVPREKIGMLPNGVDPAVFRVSDGGGGVAEELGLAGRRLFTYAGLHGHAQALHVVVEAARLLRDVPDVAFVLVGDGPRKAGLVASVAGAGLDNVRFVPAMPTPEAARLVAGSWASVVPLRRVGLLEDAVPSKIVTSLSAGVPVIFSGRGEGAELLRGHRCGVVVEPEDPEQLAGAVRWLRAHPGEREALGRRGRRLVEQEYRWERLTDHWLEGWQRGDPGTPGG
jgi:glycosyltransferase involved in cell wall biosynthesis